ANSRVRAARTAGRGRVFGFGCSGSRGVRSSVHGSWFSAPAGTRPRGAGRCRRCYEPRSRVLALLTLSLAAAAPAADLPLAEAPVAQAAPAAATDVKLALQSQKTFPRIGFLRFVENTLLAMSRPVRPELTDIFVIVPAFAGTVIAVNTDVETHRAIQKLPDP